MSSASQAIPTVEMVGPGGRVIINKPDQAIYEAKGFKVAGTEGVVDTPIAGPGVSSGMKNADIVAYAEARKIDLQGKTVKADMIKEIEATQLARADAFEVEDNVRYCENDEFVEGEIVSINDGIISIDIGDDSPVDVVVNAVIPESDFED